MSDKLSPADLPELEYLGTWLLEQPVACFAAGELIALTRLVLQGGATNVEDLAFMRRLRARIELRLEGGYWLDPTNDPAKPPPSGGSNPITGN